MIDQSVVYLLSTAAAALEELAQVTTPGPWHTQDTFLPFGGHAATVVAGDPGARGNPMRPLVWVPTWARQPYDDKANAWNNARWIIATDPRMAAPLAQLLRAREADAREGREVPEPVLAVARVVAEACGEMAHH